MKGGTCYHITGKNDKGKAVRILTDLFMRKFSEIITYGLGDSENDFSMLRAVNKAYLIQKPNGSFASKEFKGIEGVGPEGWNKAILGLLKI